MQYANIGFNGPFLSALTEAQFQREVKHHFPGEKGREQMKELYGLLKAKYAKPKTKPENPTDSFSGV